MKRVMVLLVLLLSFFVGCSRSDGDMQRILAFRSQIQNSKGCIFEAEVTADYGDKTYTFAMGCETDAHGNLSFTVRKPDSIADISGTVTTQGGKLTFDDTALAFHLLADGQLSPVSAPWIVMQALRGGYIRSYTMEGELLRLAVDDSYKSDALQLDIWFEKENQPVRADIFADNRRILVVCIKEFEIQ